MILYPTETIYALGVNALDTDEVELLEFFKGRGVGKSLSWLVRDVEDIRRWGAMSEVAAKIAEQFLPGPLTLVLEARENVPMHRKRCANEVSFRISPDPIAQQLIAEYMAEHDAPLTCTSANVSGQEAQPSPEQILEQFRAAGRDIGAIEQVIGDGLRTGLPSTVVRVIDDQIEILREGAVSSSAILDVLK